MLEVVMFFDDCFLQGAFGTVESVMDDPKGRVP